MVVGYDNTSPVRPTRDDPLRVVGGLGRRGGHVQHDRHRADRDCVTDGAERVADDHANVHESLQEKHWSGASHRHRVVAIDGRRQLVIGSSVFDAVWSCEVYVMLFC